MIFPLTKFYKLVILSLLFVTNNCSNIPKDILYETDGAQLIKAGNSLIINGKYKEAAEYYQRALTIDMTDSEAFGNLSVAFYYLGKYDDAIREAIQAIYRVGRKGDPKKLVKLKDLNIVDQLIFFYLKG